MKTRLMKAVLPLALLVVMCGCLDENGRRCTPKEACVANLKQIDGAKSTWALEHHITNEDVTPVEGDLFGATSYIRELPTCPSGGTYRIGAVREKPQCTVAGHTF